MIQQATLDIPTQLAYLPAFCDSSSHNQWKLFPHLMPVIDALQDVAEGRERRVMISMPPRHGKSWLTSKFFPAWLMCRNPNMRVIIAGYGKDFASQWGLATRNIIKEFGKPFGVTVDPSSTAKAHWKTATGGGVHCCGTGSEVTGYGADVLIIDDPVKDYATAHSPVERENAWNWLNADVMTRLEPGASVVVIQTRWHEDDVSGRLLEQAKATGEGWRVIRLPAIALDDETIGEYRRLKGEPLCPQRYPLDELEKIQRRMGPYKWSCLYQQQPTTAEGNFWPAALFSQMLQEVAPKEVQFPVIAVDPSLGRSRDKTLGDYAAVVATGWCQPRKKFWCQAVVARMRPEDITRAIADVYHNFPSRPQRIGVETHGFQEVLAMRFQEDLPRYGVPIPVIPLREHVTEAKKLRIQEMDGWMTEKMIQVYDNVGGRMLVKQLKNFPLDHDDGPDALRMTFDVMGQYGDE